MDMTISLINNISFQIITFHCTTFITIVLSRLYTNFVKGGKIKSFRGYTFANEDVQVYKEKLNYWREK
jgi:hypothetical protein